MKSIQDAIDSAHKAAGVPLQRSFERDGEKFKEPEDGPDEVVENHNAALRKQAELDECRRQFSLGMKMLLAAADGIASVRRGQR